MALRTPRQTGQVHADPAIMVGQPVIRGTRITVEWILDWLSGSFDLEEFFAAYPDLTIEDVQAALAFARDAVRDDYLRSQERKDALAASERRMELAAAKA